MALRAFMKRIRISPPIGWGSLMLALLFILATNLPAQTKMHPPSTRSVVMFSDIHFDPFHDPGKFEQLQAAPVSEWASILNAPASADQAQQFAALQQTCHAHRADTDWPLLTASLHAAQQEQPDPFFVTLSGDLTVHEFSCRFHHMDPDGDATAYMAFAAKTAGFVALQLRQAFPHSPIYISMGNNDSSCGDYRESPDSQYLGDVAKAVAADANSYDRAAILSEFPHEGDYDIPLPGPMQHTRLIVLQDIFQSSNYRSCGNKPDPAAAQQQVAWLQHHLAEAHAHGDHVWVMSHIPPGVDVYQTVKSRRNVCGGQSPDMYFTSEALANTLVQYAGEVRLVILGHTHDDELRLLKPADVPLTDDAGREIPVKLVPSITPVHGNNPAFIVARVNPATATLEDYTVFAASKQSGIGTHWSREYTWSTAYGLPDFSAASVAKLVARFQSDKHSVSALSRDYQNWFAVDESHTQGLLLRFFWPSYACSLSHVHANGFRQCVCGSTATGNEPAPAR